MDLGFVPRNARLAGLESAGKFEKVKELSASRRGRSSVAIQTRTGRAQNEKEIINSKHKRKIGQEQIKGRTHSGKDLVKTVYKGAYPSGAMSRKGKQLSVWL